MAPRERTAQKSAPNPPRKKIPSKERKEELRLKKEQAAQERRERRGRRRALFSLSLGVAVLFVALYWAWVVFSIVNRPDGSENALPILIYTQGEKEEDSRLEKEEVFLNGTYYLPVTCLEPYMAITQFGDWQTRSILLCESGEYATFYLNSENAVINGQKVAIQNNAVLKNDVLYLPVEFYTEKMNCFSFAESVPLAANVLTFQSELTPAFRFRISDSVPQIDPNTIPVPTTPPTVSP